MDIQKFISENITISPFPKSTDFQKAGHSKEVRVDGKFHDHQVVINVSDEFYLGNSEEIIKLGKLNYYFPMGETTDDMGLNSIYGALQVLYTIYKFNPEWKIVIHCQAGRNRSVTLLNAFSYMMLGKHTESSSRLTYNCQEGHLPSLDKMELFLEKCKWAFDHPQGFFGGMFDWVMIQSKLKTFV